MRAKTPEHIVDTNSRLHSTRLKSQLPAYIQRSGIAALVVEFMFCVHGCHRVDPSEVAPRGPDKFALPIVPHQLVAGVDCCGCLIVEEKGADPVNLICNECSALIKSVPVANVQQELLQMAMGGVVCSHRCQYCVCRECGSGNRTRTTVQ